MGILLIFFFHTVFLDGRAIGGLSRETDGVVGAWHMTRCTFRFGGKDQTVVD